MSEVEKTDKKTRIAELLIKGCNVKDIASQVTCSLNYVYSVQNSADFAEKCNNITENGIKIASIAALETLKDVMQNSRSDTSRVSAAKTILDCSKDIMAQNGGDNSPSTMSQAALIERLKALQDEAVKRTKPIDTGVIDADDMLS